MLLLWCWASYWQPHNPVKYQLEHNTKHPISPNITGDETGFVIFNHTDEGTIVLEFQLRGLKPDFNYYMYYAFWVDSVLITEPPYPTFGPIKVNKFGSGHFHYEIPEKIGDTYVVGISDNYECWSKGNIIMFVVISE